MSVQASTCFDIALLLISGEECLLIFPAVIERENTEKWTHWFFFSLSCALVRIEHSFHSTKQINRRTDAQTHTLRMLFITQMDDDDGNLVTFYKGRSNLSKKDFMIIDKYHRLRHRHCLRHCLRHLNIGRGDCICWKSSDPSSTIDFIVCTRLLSWIDLIWFAISSFVLSCRVDLFSIARYTVTGLRTEIYFE